VKIGNRDFDTSNNNAYIMGILNMTPDSFSDGSKHNNLEDAIIHVEKMINEGADIIDVGGESTRPGYTKISDEEEISRVVPIIKEIKKRFDIPVSVDTYKSAVAKAALEAGADMINDIWGLKYDERMAELVREYDVPVCIMHNNENEVSSIAEVIQDLNDSLNIAYVYGIKKEKIMLDPGIGFAKSYEANLNVLNNLDKLKKLGMPILLGTSKKSVIGLTLDLPVDQRGEGTIATSVIGLSKGCSFFRVHDVKENVRALKMIKAILNS